MSPVFLAQWIDVQRRQGHEVCLILDSLSEKDARQALLRERTYDRFGSVYSQTRVAELADVGPYLILIDNADTERLHELVTAPERSWGWFASLARGDLPALLQHWRERFLLGTPPNQGLYRFQDNRVLTRAIGHLPKDALPAYLGPAISVCYWQGQHWASIDNPVPGDYPLPEAPAWLHVPTPSNVLAHIRETNARRFLLDQHQPAYLELAAQRPALEWINQKRTLADAWGWFADEQLEFLLIHSLNSPGFEFPAQWFPRAHETSDQHFERVSQSAKLWTGKGAL